MSISAATQAFRTVLAAITFPTSGHKIFADPEGVYFLTDNDAETRRYPQAVISRSQGGNGSAQTAGLWSGQIFVEVRQEILVRDSTNIPGVLFGQNRSTDETAGAGIEDVVARLVAQTNYLNTDTSAQIKPFICNPREGDVRFVGNEARCTVTYDALLER